jgi:hypothetical protein
MNVYVLIQEFWGKGPVTSTHIKDIVGVYSTRKLALKALRYWKQETSKADYHVEEILLDAEAHE